MAELVLDCATLCEIQKEFGVTGVFKEDILMNWLVKHNTTEFLYKQVCSVLKVFVVNFVFIFFILILRSWFSFL